MIAPELRAALSVDLTRHAYHFTSQGSLSSSSLFILAKVRATDELTLMDCRPIFEVQDFLRDIPIFGSLPALIRSYCSCLLNNNNILIRKET